MSTYLFNIIEAVNENTAASVFLTDNIDASATMQAAPVWTASTLYPERFVVRSGGNIYQCITEHTSGSAIGDDAEKWTLIREEVPAYSASSTYAVGDVVQYPTDTPDGVYQCKLAIETAEEWNSDKWVRIARLSTTTFPTGWVPLCSASTPFQGTLDGGGNTLKNLYIYQNNTTEYNGLFLSLGKDAVIKNLVLEGCCLYRDGSGNNSGNSGAVAAQLNLSDTQDKITITNVHIVNSLVQGGRKVGSIIGDCGFAFYVSVDACSSNAVVRSLSSQLSGVFVGGLVGNGIIGNVASNTGIRRCLFNGKIYANSSTKAYVGGIYGAYSTANSFCVIEDSVFAGSITGSVVTAAGIAATPLASNYAIKRCLNIGTISLTAGSKYGICAGGSYVEDSYYNSETTGCTDQPQQQRTTAQMKSRYTLSGLDFDTTWYLPKSPVITSPFNNGYPVQRVLLDVGSSRSASSGSGVFGGRGIF